MPSAGACLLGEGNACHCACPETLPASAMLVAVVIPPPRAFALPAPHYGFAPTRALPPLRLPIA